MSPMYWPKQDDIRNPDFFAQILTMVPSDDEHAVKSLNRGMAPSLLWALKVIGRISYDLSLCCGRS